MEGCKYKTNLGCQACTYVFYNKCPNFRKAHVNFLARKITPFKFVDTKVFDTVVWSKDVNKAKSCAIKYAVASNVEVTKLTLNQVISLTISNEDVNYDVVYIDCSQKVQGEIEKISGVLKSFIDKMQLNGTKVAIYVAPTVILNLSEYHKV